MKTIVFALALTALAAGPAIASDKTDVIASARQFIDRFNKGDVEAATAICADETSIIDNFAPFEWHGPGACAKWAADFATDAKANAITDGSVMLGKPKHVDIAGDRAYAVVPASFKFKLKGKPTTQPGLLTISFQKSGSAWRMNGWAWSNM